MNPNPKVWRLEWRIKHHSSVHGVSVGDWEPWTPLKRYDLNEVSAFEQQLTVEDLEVADYRAVWSGTVLPLRPHYPKRDEDVKRLHTTMEPDEVLPPTGWGLLVHTLGTITQEQRA